MPVYGRLQGNRRAPATPSKSANVIWSGSIPISLIRSPITAPAEKVISVALPFLDNCTLSKAEPGPKPDLIEPVFKVVDLVNAIAPVEDKDVPAPAAAVIPPVGVAKDQPVIARARVNGVVAGPGKHPVAALAAEQRVITGAAEQAVIAFIPLQPVVPKKPLKPVVALSAYERVRPIPAVQPVVARAAVEEIVAFPSHKQVVATHAIEPVSVVAPSQLASAFPGVDQQGSAGHLTEERRRCHCW